MTRTTQRICRAFAVAATLAALAPALSACNTVAGAGQDVSSVGHDVVRGADSVQTGIARSTGAATH